LRRKDRSFPASGVARRFLSNMIIVSLSLIVLALIVDGFPNLPPPKPALGIVDSRANGTQRANRRSGRFRHKLKLLQKIAATSHLALCRALARSSPGVDALRIFGRETCRPPFSAIHSDVWDGSSARAGPLRAPVEHRLGPWAMRYIQVVKRAPRSFQTAAVGAATSSHTSLCEIVRPRSIWPNQLAQEVNGQPRTKNGPTQLAVRILIAPFLAAEDQAGRSKQPLCLVGSYWFPKGRTTNCVLLGWLRPRNGEVQKNSNPINA